MTNGIIRIEERNGEMTDMNLQGFLAYHKGNAYGVVITDAGKVLTDKELRAYARWGLLHGYKLLSGLPEFETIKELDHDEDKAMSKDRKAVTTNLDDDKELQKPFVALYDKISSYDFDDK